MQTVLKSPISKTRGETWAGRRYKKLCARRWTSEGGKTRASSRNILRYAGGGCCWPQMIQQRKMEESIAARCLTETERERERNTGERFKCFSIRGDFIKAEIPASREGGRRDVPESGGLVPRRPRCESSKSSMEKEIEKEDTGGEKEENG